jgi:hypothetical protein
VSVLRVTNETRVFCTTGHLHVSQSVDEDTSQD